MLIQSNRSAKNSTCAIFCIVTISWIISTCHGATERSEPEKGSPDEDPETRKDIEEFRAMLRRAEEKSRIKMHWIQVSRSPFWHQEVLWEKRNICRKSCCVNSAFVSALGPTHGAHDCCQTFFGRLTQWRLGECKGSFGEPARVARYPRSVIDMFKFGIIPKIQEGLGDVRFCDDHIVSLIKHVIMDIEIPSDALPSKDVFERIKDALLTPNVHKNKASAHILDENRPGMMLNYAEGWEPSDMCKGYFSDEVLKRMEILPEKVRTEFYLNLWVTGKVGMGGFKKSANPKINSDDGNLMSVAIADKMAKAVVNGKLKISRALLPMILKDIEDTIAIPEQPEDLEESPPKAGKKPPPPPPDGNEI